jgi:hypothetical protein
MFAGSSGLLYRRLPGGVFIVMPDVVFARAHRALFVAGLLTALVAWPPGGIAQGIDKALQERMGKEKADRRGCKIQICDIARNRKTEGPDISCNVVKTWTGIELRDRVLKGRIDWPWGNAQCQANITLQRSMLATALAGPTAEAKLAKQAVNCTLDQKDGADKYSISFAITPTVTFSGGKATKAALNWSDITGSALAKGAVWSAATLDNNIGVFEGATVEAINAFFGDQCDEVKDELGK